MVAFTASTFTVGTPYLPAAPGFSVSSILGGAGLASGSATIIGVSAQVGGTLDFTAAAFTASTPYLPVAPAFSASSGQSLDFTAAPFVIDPTSASTPLFSLSTTGVVAGSGVAFGNSTVFAVGVQRRIGIGLSSGSATIVGIGMQVGGPQPGIGSATGIGSAFAISRRIQSGLGIATGSASVSAVGVGRRTFPGIGIASGIATVFSSGIAVGTFSGAGLASGLTIIAAIGRGLGPLQQGIGTARGELAIDGVGAFTGQAIIVSTEAVLSIDTRLNKPQSVVINNNRTIKATSMVAYMKDEGWSRQRVISYCRQRGWAVREIRQPLQ